MTTFAYRLTLLRLVLCIALTAGITVPMSSTVTLAQNSTLAQDKTITLETATSTENALGNTALGNAVVGAVAAEKSEVTVEEVNKEEAKDTLAALRNDANVLWIVLAACLVFFMQAGFALVESGFTRAKNACNIVMKNVMDLSMGSIAFWLVGFGLMFGASGSGFIGTEKASFMPDFGEDGYGWAFLIFQTVFAATAATIVSGAMAERTKYIGYLLYSLAICVVVYPIFGAWAWGSLWHGNGWLEGLGFYDFAGSTVVHSIGGWAALAGAIVLGARNGKFNKEGKAQPIPGHNIPMAALGVFILWLGWFGFNAGSTTAVGGGVGGMAYIAVTTNLSAAAGAVAAMLASWVMFNKPDPSFTVNGALAGLVGITAGCDAVAPGGAVIIGLIAGVTVVLSVVMFDKLRIDDPVGAVSVHGVCGAWGTLAVGLFSTSAGLLYGHGATQFVAQLIGVGAAFAWAFPVSLSIFLAIKHTVGLRVNAEEEREGLDLHEHGMLAYPPHLVTESFGTSVQHPTAVVASLSSPVTAATRIPSTEGT